jgi:excisionase family DNA binding protein
MAIKPTPPTDAVQKSAGSHVAELPSAAILNKQQAATYIQATPRYLERMVATGRLRAYRPTGKLWRVRRSDLDAFLESGATIGGGPQ